MISLLDRFTGCLLGGAVGDALGARAEFKTIEEIREDYGPNGVTGYLGSDGKGRFTDDTQMTVFTADGLIRAAIMAKIKKARVDLSAVVHKSYLRWLHTQALKLGDVSKIYDVREIETGWLVKEKRLSGQRFAGMTCIQSLESGERGTITDPINISKGCGGIMRIAPVGLAAPNTPYAFEDGCAVAAITHGHPTGWLAAGFQSAMIHCLLNGGKLAGAIRESLDLLKCRIGHEECLSAVEDALEAAGKSIPSPESIARLGKDRVAEGVLAISLYCALSFPGDFRKAVLAAVNHGGDSDSTAAVTGNILGVMLGRDAIPAEWISNLEAAGIVERVAADLQAVVKGGDFVPGREWLERYPVE